MVTKTYNPATKKNITIRQSTSPSKRGLFAPTYKKRILKAADGDLGRALRGLSRR